MNYQSWLEHDPDETDRAALVAQIKNPDPAVQERLAQVFATPLSFGTAGLRAEMGPGPGRMNTAVILRATFGLSSVLHEAVGAGFRVVIGYDARHRSSDFARVAAEVVAASGGQAELMPRHCPTPLLAFYLRKSGADCGIMVTASHNPAADNGYKVYLGGRVVQGCGQGVQLVSPWDQRIMAAINAAPAPDAVPRDASFTTIDEDVWRRYRRVALDSTPVEEIGAGSRQGLRIVLTSMHGVGAELSEALLRDAGFTQVFPVAAQREPDPDFPTVAFPNPEEAGALDLAIARAREVDADLILATDPDADRCSVAVPDATAGTGWRQLSGDEVGSLLGFAACSRPRPSAAAPSTVARSLVSGGMLDRIAAAAGVVPMVTLTGFKWIARTPEMIFGYEEALGLCSCPEMVRDKDGITACLQVALLAARLRETTAAHSASVSPSNPPAVTPDPRSLSELLDDLAIQHGLFYTTPLTFRLEDLSKIAAGMARLRGKGQAAIPQLGTEPVTFTLDLAQNPSQSSQSAVEALRPARETPGNNPNDPETVARRARNGWENLAQLPPTDALMFGTDSGTRVVVRPSGTEPKLKCYLQVVIPRVTSQTLKQARGVALERAETIKSQLCEALGF